MKLSKSEDEYDAFEDSSPIIVLLEQHEDEEESLLRESARDHHEEAKELLDVIAQVESTEENPAGLNGIKTYLLALCGVLQTAVLLLSMHLFSDRHNKEEIYEMRHVTFLSDIVKMAIACYLEYTATQGHLLASLRTFVKERPKDAFLMLIPALLFELHDWLARVSLDGNLNPRPFRLFQETRILLTAIVSMRVLKTSYSFKQWICMIAVWLGMFLSTIDHALSKAMWNDDSSNNILGYESAILAVVCFAVGSVYFEHVVKVVPEEEGDVSPTLWMRLIQLYFFSSLIHASRGGLHTEPEDSYFTGFGPLVWMLVFGRAFAGLAISVTIYFTDNVLKCLAVAGGTTLAAILYAFSWDASSGSLFLIGCFIVGLGVWFYCKPLPRACRRRS